ncbi:MAG: PQQ-dependent sugar dehydrogenase [Gemmataceae bacterium]
MTRRRVLIGVAFVPALLALPAAADRPFGVDRLPPLTTSTVVGSPDPPPPYRAKRVYSNYAPSYPVMVKPVPATDQLLVITEDSPYAGTHLFRVRDDAAVTDKDTVKLHDTKGVAYDIAFHPKFADNGYVYIGWNLDEGDKHLTRISRYTLAPKPPYAFDATATTVIDWASNGHNGGAICFGPDGTLYVTSGDGTADSDKNVVGQTTDTLLSKVLRIDVDRPDAGRAYAVPKDNPFVGDARFRPETWAYGLRNPWRISYDFATDQLWVGNNGQDLWEQAYLVKKGANYGWSVMEGGHPFYPTRQTGPTPISPPTVDHPHSEFRSLTGGVVYRGRNHPDLIGAYVYGDYSTGRVWGIKVEGDKTVWHKELARTTLKITAITADARGELLICDHQPAGKSGLYTLEPTPRDDRPTTFPRTLSASGLFDSVPDHRMKPGVLPYSVSASFWSDGLYKERFIALPPEGTIGHKRTGGWDFPDRTVIVKSFAAERAGVRRWVETRFLTKQDGEWAGYSYVWNDAGTDATLVGPAGLDREVATDAGPLVWRYPSRTECMICHSRAANFVLGLCEVQMNKDHDYPGGRDNQIRVFDHVGRLTRDSKEKDATPPRALVDPYDPSQDLTRRARSWLHANCSACHVEAGGGNARMELEFTTAADKMRVLNEKPLHDTFGLTDARLVAPGHPERSVVLHRIGKRGPGQMPPLSSNRIDEAGVAMMREWIAGLK